MIRSDVTLNVILSNARCRSNVTLPDMDRRPNITLDPIDVRSYVTPGPTNVTLTAANVTLTPGRAGSLRCERRIVQRGRCPDRGLGCRGAARWHHVDARLRRRHDVHGSITGLRFSLGLRPTLDSDALAWNSAPTRDKGRALSLRRSQTALRPSPA